MGEKNGLRYTDANVTGIAKFGPVKYLDVTCNIEAVPGNRSNLNGWDLYNFTYRYPDAEHVSDDPRFDLTQFRDVFNISALYDGVEIGLAAKSKVEVQAVMFNNTHYLRHLPMDGSNRDWELCHSHYGRRWKHGRPCLLERSVY
jgi:hypothetical protein